MPLLDVAYHSGHALHREEMPSRALAIIHVVYR